MNIKFIKYENGCLLLRTDDPDMKFLTDFKPGEYEIVKFRKKRSTRANSYMWALCRDIAEACPPLTVDDVYQDAVKEMPVFKEYHNMTEDGFETFKVAWEKLGKGWFVEKVDYEADGEHVWCRAYYGSSVYNVKQMQRLINILLEQARSVGLSTPEDDYIRNLMEDYERSTR